MKANSRYPCRYLVYNANANASKLEIIFKLVFYSQWQIRKKYLYSSSTQFEKTLIYMVKNKVVTWCWINTQSNLT